MIDAAIMRRLSALKLSSKAFTEVLAIIAELEAGTESRLAANASRTRLYRRRGGGNIPEEMREAVFERDAYRCLYCSSEDRLECDHKHPVSRGGETTLENLQTLCRSCNAKKRDRIRKSDVNSTELLGIETGIVGNGSGNSVELPFPPIPPSNGFPTPLPVITPLPPIPCSLRSHSGDDPFEDFCKAYPKRDGANPKLPARKRFLAACKSGVDAAAIVNSARKYAAELAAKGQVGTPYVAQMVTWLTQQRWGDYATGIAPPPSVKPVRQFPNISRELTEKYARWWHPEIPETVPPEQWQGYRNGKAADENPRLV